MPHKDWWVDHQWRERLLEEGYALREFGMEAFENVFIEELFDDIRRWLKKEKHFIILEDKPSENELKASLRYHGIELMVYVDEIMRHANSSETRVFLILLSKKESAELSDFITEFWEHVEEAAKQNYAVPRAVFKIGCLTCGRPLEEYCIICSECTEKYGRHRAGKGLARLADFAKKTLKKADGLQKAGKHVQASREYALLSKTILEGLTLPAGFLLTVINENEGLHHLATLFKKKAHDLASQ